MAGLPQQGGDQAGHHGHRARYEEPALSDGSEERAVRLRRQMSQVGSTQENKMSKFFFFSFIVSVEKGGYYEGEEEEDEYYEMQDDELISQEV